MYRKGYSNFVRSGTETESAPVCTKRFLSGTEASKLYLEEVKEVKDPTNITYERIVFDKRKHNKRKKTENVTQFCEKELFHSVQSNDVNKLSQILDTFPDKLHTLDTYGWSLLMIACQANAVDTVSELLKRGIDTSVRDKAGNSAYSLVIKNRNVIIADILLNNRSTKQNIKQVQTQAQPATEEYTCNICDNKLFSDKQKHLSSTLHNLNASKGKKMLPNYVIPESNKGYQILLRGGWNKEAGLGPDGSGKKYPIKAFQKLDKYGLGHKKKKIQTILEESQEKSKLKNLRNHSNDKNRQIEINFRREFY